MEVLVLYWFFRHAIYFGAAIALWVLVPESVTGIIIFFFLIHSYKIGRFLYDESVREKKERNEEPAKMDKDGNFV